MEKRLVTVTHALLSTEGILDLLRQNYSLDGPITCVLEKSAPNSVYRIATQEGIFALKIFSSAGEFEFEYEYVQFLLRQGVHVAKQIPTDSGAPFFFTSCFDLKIYGVLHEYVRGTEPAHHEPADALAYGQELARLHLASAQFAPSMPPPAFEPVRRLQRSMDCIVSVLRSLEQFESIDQYQSAAANLAEKLNDLSSQCVSSQFLHGDTHGGNAKIIKGEIWFFDFELACLGPVEWDLACFKWASKIGKREESYHHFLDGYRKVVSNPVSSEEVVNCLSALKEFEVVSNHLNMSKILGSWFITERYLAMRLGALSSGIFNS